MFKNDHTLIFYEVIIEKKVKIRSQGKTRILIIVGKFVFEGALELVKMALLWLLQTKMGDFLFVLPAWLLETFLWLCS